MTTTFRRQVTLILCLLLTTLLVTGLAFNTLYRRAAAQEKTGAMSSAADSVATLLQAYSRDYLTDWDFRTNLALLADATDLDILVCDPQGQVILCSGSIGACSHTGRCLDPELVQQLLRGEDRGLAEAVSELYEQRRLAVALPVADGGGHCLGILLVSMSQIQLAQLTAGTLRTFMIIALLVLLIALLATPLLARRETKPIRDMAAAARLIAHGKQGVRVPTDHPNREIQELALAFNNMAAAVERAETVRQEFVGNVSHELKTPMTTIAGYLDGMLDGTIPPAQHRHYMERVAAEARRLSRLVRSMLDISRLRDQGVQPQQRRDFDLCEAAAESLLAFEQPINRKGLQVEIDLPDPGLLVWAMPEAVGQVLSNLLENAVKFSPQGGSLTVRVSRRGEKALLSVSNTGPTIPPEELPLLFDRFHKADRSRSNDRDGAGLGLYIVKTIVLAHGEDIFVSSREGLTEFSFTLPIAK